MKRLLSILLAFMMLFSFMIVPSFATEPAEDDYVISPEYDIIEDEDVPTTDVPSSPQTGEFFTVTAAAVVVLLCGGVAILSKKKAQQYS